MKNNDVTDVLTVKFEQGSFKGKTYRISLESGCTNPVCSCTDAWVSAVCLDRKDNQEYQKAPDYKIPLTLEKKALTKGRIKSLGEEEEGFAKALLAEASDQLWEYLENVFYSYKSKITEMFSDYSSLEVDFAEDEIENESFMVGYADVFPYAEVYPLSSAGTNYILNDQYCLSSTCNCTHAAITFIRIGNEEKTTAQILPHLLYDYKSRKAEISIDPSYPREEFDQDLVKTLFNELRSLIPNLAGILKKRHRIMRLLYSNYLNGRSRNENEKISLGEKKTGRNDPCPCGSGKKYKRCCDN